jgi:CubicO group peptidase (beta-lactamase class C family)
LFRTKNFVTPLLVLLIVTAPSLLAEASSQADANLEKKLAAVREHVEYVLKDSGIPGFAVGIVKDGKVVFAEGFGYRDLKNKLPVTENTLFPLGSITKAMTGLTVGMLVNDGHVQFDEPVRTYLPEFQLKDSYRTVHTTVKDVLSMRTGLAAHNFMWLISPKFSQEEVIKRMGHLDLPLGFRSGFIYCNLSIFVGGCITSRLSNMAWEDFVRQRIFGPLDMTQSCLTIDELKSFPEYSLPYSVDFSGETPPQELALQEIYALRSTGSLNASTNDMLKWMQFFLNKGKVGGKQLVSRRIIDEMWKPHIPFPQRPMTQAFFGLQGYGLAWFVGTYRGKYYINHGGAAAGFHAFIGLLPDDNIGVFAVHNGSAFFTDAIVKHTLDLFLDVEPVNWYAPAKKGIAAAQQYAKRPKKRIPDTQPSHPLQDYTGKYVNPGYGTLDVKLKDGVLFGTYNGSDEFEFEHWHYDTFRAKTPLGWLGSAEVMLNPSFHADSRGRIKSLSIPLEPMAGPIVYRK